MHSRVLLLISSNWASVRIGCSGFSVFAILLKAVSHLFQFHYEIAVRRRLLLEGRDAGAVFETVSHHIDTFLGKRFEWFCAEYLRTNYPTAEQGKWWIDTSDFHAEIDIVSRISAGKNSIDLFTECKFRKELADFREYAQLDAAASYFEKTANPRPMIISVSGFDGELTAAAEGLNLVLIGPDELFGRSPAPAADRINPNEKQECARCGKEGFDAPGFVRIPGNDIQP